MFVHACDKTLDLQQVAEAFGKTVYKCTVKELAKKSIEISRKCHLAYTIFFGQKKNKKPASSLSIL